MQQSPLFMKIYPYGRSGSHSPPAGNASLPLQALSKELGILQPFPSYLRHAGFQNTKGHGHQCQRHQQEYASRKYQTQHQHRHSNSKQQ